MARILLGVTGGIAAYKGLELARLATRSGHSVRVLMTESALAFVGAASFEGITGAPVLVSEHDHDPMGGAYPGEDPPGHDPISHLELAERADVMIVAPASANTIAKLASGVCDSMLTTSFLACQAPRLVAPAMNERMFLDAATQANLAVLTERGIEVIDPGEGALASRGESGVGRLPEPAELLTRIEAAIDGPAQSLAGVRVLVTAGGTREPVDSVRFLGNRSSGRMGFALATEAARRGAAVELVAANVSLPTPAGVVRTDVATTAELAAACLDLAARSDVILMAAAPADFRPATATGGKGKIEREGDGIDLHLEPTEDILAGIVATRRPGQRIIGFAAEHGPEGISRARRKLERKAVDAIVFNDISDPAIGFDSGENAVTIITAAGETAIERASKDRIAAAILDQTLLLRD